MAIFCYICIGTVSYAVLSEKEKVYCRETKKKLLLKKMSEKMKIEMVIGGFKNDTRQWIIVLKLLHNNYRDSLPQ
jgi:hypothetical protein